MSSAFFRDDVPDNEKHSLCLIDACAALEQNKAVLETSVGQLLL